MSTWDEEAKCEGGDERETPWTITVGVPERLPLSNAALDAAREAATMAIKRMQRHERTVEMQRRKAAEIERRAAEERQAEELAKERARRTDHQRVDIVYRNHRGEVAVRTICPHEFFYGATEWHTTPQWLCEAHDAGRGETRTFAMCDILAWDVQR